MIINSPFDTKSSKEATSWLVLAFPASFLLFVAIRQQTTWTGFCIELQEIEHTLVIPISGYSAQSPVLSHSVCVGLAGSSSPFLLVETLGTVEIKQGV